MHWSEALARRVIEKKPDKECYVCATGISPSGSIHIGNFRDTATSYFVVKALRKLGKKAILLHSWDNFDRLRKIPVNVTKPGMENYIGCPYVDTPNPFEELDNNAKSYADYFQREFSQELTRFGIEPEYRFQAEMYRSGAYTEEILLALRERGRIFDIIDSFRTQDAQEGERENYFPVSIYCDKCGRDTTKIIEYDEEKAIARYTCKCGHTAEFDFHKDHNCKLSWKVDWAMRWRYEGVDFEPGGQDHASPSGSYQTSKIISKEIFGYEAPVFQGYGFIGLRGAAGKMSGSSGLNLTPKALLQVYQPEVILWLYSKNDPTHFFDFCFDDGILRQYNEFDRTLQNTRNGKGSDADKDILYNAEIENRNIYTVPMGWLVQFGSVVNFNPDVLEAVFKKLNTPYAKADFMERLELAKNWLELCSPESVNRLRNTRNWDYYNQMPESERKEVKILFENLSNNHYELDDLNTMLYAVPAQAAGVDINSLSAKEKKNLQAAFFKNIYQLLINKDRGPRLYWFLYALEPERYLALLDFSRPVTDEEKQENKNQSGQNIARKFGEEEADGQNNNLNNLKDFQVTVKPVKPEINIDAFRQMDIRVCEILKCQEIRKSHNCYKLTLDDGLDKRVIVSSIKHDYTPEELIGKKILVLANLEPARITGVNSDGMLLAAMDDNQKTAVIFVDSDIPNGAALC